MQTVKYLGYLDFTQDMRLTITFKEPNAYISVHLEGVLQRIINM